ncbi:hypothetical protein BXY66_0121 [Shimia isoporae]|uniref:Uncharacterized protein n=1 Tax=Shimia isoporae TaxID=647720 RepID=A0A4R1NS64_9RHOB|nr:hypothetical protein [Shimia isoporae]TCL08088.1 hypothetical protein BXY66_0121 [Shimia isoporae]
MNAMTRLGTLGADSWHSLTAAPVNAGYRFSETKGRFRHTSRNEALLRFLGLTLVMGALVQWTLPNANFVGDPNSTKALLSIGFSLVGMALYHFAVRGHRSEISFDPIKGEIVVCALSRQDRQKGTRRIHLSKVKSIYVRRSDMPPGEAALRIRLNDTSHEITAIRGAHDEIELAHGLLCRDIRMAKKRR